MCASAIRQYPLLAESVVAEVDWLSLTRFPCEVERFGVIRLRGSSAPDGNADPAMQDTGPEAQLSEYTADGGVVYCTH